MIKECSELDYYFHLLTLCPALLALLMLPWLCDLSWLMNISRCDPKEALKMCAKFGHTHKPNLVPVHMRKPSLKWLLSLLPGLQNNKRWRRPELDHRPMCMQLASQAK